MMTKRGVGKIKTVTTGAGGQAIEVSDSAEIVKSEGKNVTVKIGTSDVSVELDDKDEVEVVKMMHGRKLAAYILERGKHE
jgi:hypothetical protein